MRAANPALLLYTGPPCGTALFRAALTRMGKGEAVSVIDPEHPRDGWTERGAAIAARLRMKPTVLLAHGLSVPAAIAAALAAPPVALVLSNGPITRLDPFTALVARAAAAPGGAALLPRTLFHPEVWLRWLASSAGLRRAVVNPYVMDRDTVATVCGPEVATPAHRRATNSYLASLAGGLPDARGLTCPVLLLWGDEDALYPASEATILEATLPRVSHRAISGGRFLHPEERPWAIADVVSDWVAEGMPTTSMS